MRFHLIRNLHPRDVTTFRGIPVTTVARTLVDLSDVITKWELTNVIHEAAFRDRFHERAGNPEPLVNVHLNGYEVDFHWPQLRLALEIDGSGHERKRTQNEDEIKERAWREAGYEVLRDPQLALRTASVASS